MGIRIIADSTADIAEELRGRLDIVPLTVRFGAEEYIDGVTITRKEFYEKLVTTKTMPSTSQGTPAAFSEVFDEVIKSGDSAVVITIASRLSGTYQSAIIASKGHEDRIFVVDSENVTIGAGILIEYALMLADSGKSAKEIAQSLEEQKKRIIIVALLDTLEFLKRGGRISKTAALAGTLLSIKPVVAVQDGTITTLGKARGMKNANNLLAEEIKKAGGIDFDMPLLLGYTGNSDDMLQRYITDSRSLWEKHRASLDYTSIGSVVGTHAGPGAIAVAFFKNSAK